MAVAALTVLSIQVASATSGGTAPGGAAAPTGCTLTSPIEIGSWVTQSAQAANVATVDATTFGSGGYSAFVAGLKSGSLSLNILNDYAASAINVYLGMNGTKIAVGATGFVEVKPTTAARSATNPAFICMVVNNGWQSFNATVGGLATVTWAPVITGGFAELVA